MNNFNHIKAKKKERKKERNKERKKETNKQRKGKNDHNLDTIVTTFELEDEHILVGFTSHQHYKGYVAIYHLYWWRKTSGAAPCIFLGRAGT